MARIGRNHPVGAACLAFGSTWLDDFAAGQHKPGQLGLGDANTWLPYFLGCY
jgi:hypothetical protein